MAAAQIRSHDELVPSAQRLKLDQNNFVFDVQKFKTMYPVVVEILKGHTLYHTLSRTKTVPYYISSTILVHFKILSG